MTDPVAEAAQAAGVRLSVTPEAQARKRSSVPLLERSAHFVGERWAHACARIYRILEGAGQGGASTTVAAVRDAEMPLLAAEYMRQFKLFTYLRFRDHDSNPYRGMSDRDSARKFMRIVEDICDRSTGKLGAWYVK